MNKITLLGTGVLFVLVLSALPALALDKAAPSGVQLKTATKVQVPSQVTPATPTAPTVKSPAMPTSRAAGKMTLPRLLPYSGCVQVNTTNGADIRLKGINLDSYAYRLQTKDKATGKLISHVPLSRTFQEIYVKSLDTKPGMTVVAEMLPRDIADGLVPVTWTEVLICSAPTRMSAADATKNQSVTTGTPALQPIKNGKPALPPKMAALKGQPVVKMDPKSTVSRSTSGTAKPATPVLRTGTQSKGVIYKAVVSYDYAQRIRSGIKLVSPQVVNQFKPIKSLEGGAGSEQKPDLQPMDGAIDPPQDQSPSAEDCPPGEMGCSDVVDNSGGGVTDPPQDWESNTTVSCPGGAGAECVVLVRVNPLGEPVDPNDTEMEEFCANNTAPVDFGCDMIEKLANVDPLREDSSDSSGTEEAEDPCDGQSKEGDCADCEDPDGDNQCGTADESNSEEDDTVENESESQGEPPPEGMTWNSDDGDVTYKHKNEGGGTTTTEGGFVNDEGEQAVYDTTFSDDTDMTDAEKREAAEADAAEAHAHSTGDESTNCTTMYQNNGIWQTMCN